MNEVTVHNLSAACFLFSRASVQSTVNAELFLQMYDGLFTHYTLALDSCVCQSFISSTKYYYYYYLDSLCYMLYRYSRDFSLSCFK